MAALVALAGARPAAASVDEARCPSGVEGRPVLTVALDGLVHTLPIVVLRELANGPRLVFSCEAWTAERRRLEGLDIFADIGVDGRDAGEGTDLEYRFRELPVFIAFPSVKRTDQEGWLLGLGGASVNLFGRAVKLEAAARTSVSPAFRTRELLVYSASRWLGDLPVGQELWVQVNQTFNVLKRFDEHSAHASLDLYPRLVERLEGVAAFGLFRVAHDPGSPEPFLGSGGADWVPRLGVGLRREGRDRPGDAREGTYAEVRVTQHGGALGGPADYREWLLDLRGVTTVFDRHVLLASGLVRQRVGTVPFYDALHVGGPNTLRAYAPDPDRRGDSESLANVEYRGVVVERRRLTLAGLHAFWGLQAVLGADAAWLWDGGDPRDDGRRFSAVYAGLHAVLPGVERLRVEYGVQGGAWAFGLTVGLYERSTIQRWRIR